jgi:hypothetical protein
MQGEELAPDCVIRQPVPISGSNSLNTPNSPRVGRCARAIGTGDRSNAELLRVISIFSLWATNLVPMPAGGNARPRHEPLTSDTTEHFDLLMEEKQSPEDRLSSLVALLQTAVWG